MKTIKLLCLSAAAFTLAGHLVQAASPSTAFTYQGRLFDGGAPANGLYDLQFINYDAAAGGNALGAFTTNALPVTNGLFTLTLDFGGVFDGSPRWLEISERANGAAAFATLAPRQLLAAAPYAAFASSAGLAALATNVLAGAINGTALAGGAVTGDKIASGQVVKSLNGLNDNVMLVAGANITLGPGSNNTLTIASTGGGGGGWALAGNAGTTPGVNFVGTTDNQPLELKAHGQRVMRFEPTTDSPNVIGGSPLNSVSGGFTGATIGGGGGGTDPETGPNLVVSPFGTIGGGSANQILVYSAYATIGGGLTNVIQGASYYGTIGGGTGNSIVGNGFGITLAGGAYNAVSGADYATLGGGAYSTLGFLAHHSVLAGGYFNSIADYASDSVVGGGSGNAVGTSVQGATIAGGEGNTTGDGTTGTGGWSSVGGGNYNWALGSFSTIGGGLSNYVASDVSTIEIPTTNISYSTIGGGERNSVGAANGTIGGGTQNTAGGWGSTIGGGERNSVGGWAAGATIGGGSQNTAIGPRSTIAGGIANVASGPGAFVGGGGYDGSTTSGNTASGPGSTIGGGTQNLATGSRSTIGGGHDNAATNWYATVPGGAWNVAGGQGSFAAGQSALALNDGCFVWNCDWLNALSSTAANQFLARASGGFAFYTSTSGGATLAAGSGSWTSMSDRHAKENFAPLDPQSVLAKVAALPLSTWNYKAQDPAIRHLGPMAQDFKAAFGVGETDTGITSVDADGVALAAIQGLNQKLEETRAENAALKARLEKLERLVQSPK